MTTSTIKAVSPSVVMEQGSLRTPQFFHALAIAARVILDQSLDVLAPQLERRPLLRRVARSIVDAGDAGLVAADVVQHRLDDVRLHAELCHAGSHRAPDIVQPP